MDFTIKQFQQLLNALQQKGYSFQTFEEFMSNPMKNRVVVMRHDVDRLPPNALILAQLEHEMDIKSSYYFRVVPSVWNENIIQQIVDLGHEVAYHYEDLTLTKGDYEKAITHFEYHLQQLRKFYPSRTICMHGSPMSKWDNRKIWDKYNYQDYGIIGEPYFDVDYSKVFYVTDTGRAWNNSGISIRDVVASGFNIQIKSTKHFIELIEKDKLPDTLIINTHPHRWFKPSYGWARELILQNLKNQIKRIIVSAK